MFPLRFSPKDCENCVRGRCSWFCDYVVTCKFPRRLKGLSSTLDFEWRLSNTTLVSLTLFCFFVSWNTKWHRLCIDHLHWCFCCHCCCCYVHLCHFWFTTVMHDTHTIKVFAKILNISSYSVIYSTSAVKLILWRHWMLLCQVHAVTSENQFHSIMLYFPTRTTMFCIHLIHIHAMNMLW